MEERLKMLSDIKNGKYIDGAPDESIIFYGKQ